MYLPVRHPRDSVRRDGPDVAARGVHFQAVALSDQAVGGDGAIGRGAAQPRLSPPLSGLSNLPRKPIQITSNLIVF